MVSTPLKNISQNGNLPQMRVENNKCLKPPPKYYKNSAKITTRPPGICINLWPFTFDPPKVREIVCPWLISGHQNSPGRKKVGHVSSLGITRFGCPFFLGDTSSPSVLLSVPFAGAKPNLDAPGRKLVNQRSVRYSRLFQLQYIPVSRWTNP